MSPQGSSRLPSFIARGLKNPGVEAPQFAGAKVNRRPTGEAPLRAAPAPEPAAPPAPTPASLAAAEAQLVAERERLATEFGHRVASAVEVLRSAAHRLGADVRVEAIELALLVARRILDAEVTTSVEPLVGLVRGAVRRLGEARKIVVRLCPADVEAVTAAAAGAKPLAGIAVAEIELLPDPALGRGDCVVEGELGTVDGRLSVRLEEVRRALLATVLEEQEGGR